MDSDGCSSGPNVPWLVVLIPLLAAAEGGAAGPFAIGDVLRAVNEERAGLGRPALERSSKLDRAARAKVERFAAEVRQFPTARPDHVLSLARLDDLPEHLAKAGFRARRASAHVLVADRDLRPGDLLEGDPRLASDLMDPELREVGFWAEGVGGLEIGVAVIARSRAIDFRERTADLADRTQVRRELLQRANGARRKERRPPLLTDHCLQEVAQRFAEEMVAGGFYGHESPDGADVADRARAAGCRTTALAENLARGQTNPDEVVKGWLESPGHRANLLSRRHRRVGHGVAVGRAEDEYWVVWVQVFSAR